MRLAAGACALLLCLAGASARACGVCIEDKVAATYDYAVVKQAAERRHVVVFAAFDGPGDAAALGRALAQAARDTRGVDRHSVRTSATPPAVSFALDPVVLSPRAAVSELERRVRAHGIALTLLKVMRGMNSLAGE